MAKNFDDDFIKSSASGVWSPIACVEVKRGPNTVQVRDSKAPDAATLDFTHDEWEAFLTGAKGGEFDL